MFKVCSVFGHCSIIITKELESKLLKTLEYLIKKGCEYFYFGGFGMFDELCHKLVSELKKTYKHIKRIYCLSDPRHLRINKRPKYLRNEDYEDFIYLDLDFDWWYKRIYYRNCAMIDRSDIVLFYAEERENSGAYKALKYAKQTKKQIINLFEQK
ncbi:MAG: hypothetical protein IJX26_03600 [Clostridia bacterium]|nr:hypothetical protein [Clostridia bacterium]